MNKFILFTLAFFCLSFCSGQGTTTCELSGQILSESGTPMEDATLTLVNTNTNTTIHGFSQSNGIYLFDQLKAASGYQLHITYLGKETFISESFTLGLGEKYIINITLKDAAVPIEDIDIYADAGNKIDLRSRTNSNNISMEEIEMFPSISRSLVDYVRLNPSAGSSGFLGRGYRDNFISIDGSAFNNVYGIGGPISSVIGNVVGADPFGIDALQEIQVSTTPYDVSLGGFTGAGINALSQSGSNQLKGTAYTYHRSDAYVGNSLSSTPSQVSAFSNSRLGVSLGGPIIKDKIFFFINVETNQSSSPGSNFLASRPDLEGDNVTRVKASDLDDLSNFLKENYNYTTGPYENYNLDASNQKILLNLDWRLTGNNRLSLRFNALNAEMEDHTTNSGSFGSGNRVENLNSMSFQNSGQVRTVKSRSLAAELFSTLNSNTVNQPTASFSYFPDARKIRGDFFPSVDIRNQNRTYISFGSHLFASNNRIDQTQIQIKDELSKVMGNHYLSIGVSYERYQFEYEFTPAFAGSFIFNSLEDFYNSSPIGSITPLGLSNGIGRPVTYARRYNAGAEGSSAVNPIYSRSSLYIKDEWQSDRLLITAGIRADYNNYGGSPLNNENISALVYQNENGEPEQFTSNALPNSNIAFSPRLGFNWQLDKSKKVFLRGGAGVFTGLPSMVRIGDQFVNNGLLQGEIIAKGNQANQYPFNPDPEAYIPEQHSSPNTFDVNYTVSDYKTPTLFRTSLGLDYHLSESWIATVDVSYSKDLYRDHVRNLNLDRSANTMTNDGRLEYTSSGLNNPPILGAYLLDNSTEGEQLYTTLQLQKEFSNDWFATVAYTWGQSKDVNSFGASTTRSAFRNLPVAGNANDPTLAFSDFDLAHRAISYFGKNFNFFSFGSTSFSIFIEAIQEGRFSYTYASNGDINKDGVPSNDLIFVPNTLDDIALEEYKSNGMTFTVEDQWAALDAFISSSSYLDGVRGKIAERNGNIMPWYWQANLKFKQDLNLFNDKNRLSFTLDIFNLANLINDGWGVRQLPANTRPIQAMKNGKFRVSPGNLKAELIDDFSAASRWQLQFGLKYRFN